MATPSVSPSAIRKTILQALVIASADRRRAVLTECQNRSAVGPCVGILNACAACAGARAESNSSAGVRRKQHGADALRSVVDKEYGLAESKIVRPTRER